MEQLRIPGPTPVPDDVRQAMARLMINHRGPEFAETITRTTKNLKTFFQTKNEVLILTGRGVAKSAQGDRPLKVGDVIFVPANEKHQFVNSGNDPLSFICLIPAPRTCGE